MQTLTQDQLKEKLLALTCATPITITALTEVRAPLYGKPLYRMSRINGMAAINYSAAVNRLIPFIPKPRQWGYHVSPAVIENKTKEGTKHYLQLKVERSLSSVYLAQHGSLLKVVEKKALEGMLRERDERPVTVRDYSLGSIKRISFGGKKYRIV